MNPKRPPDPPMTLANISERSASPTTPNSIAAAETVSAPLSLETYLNPAAFPCDEPTISALRQQLAAGRLIVIRDAFVASFAEQIHGSLDACTAWQIHEAYQKDFHYRHHNLYKKSDYPPDLTWCDQIFGSPATKALVQRLSGRECIGPTQLSASWYLPGDHSLPHDDAGVAFPIEATLTLKLELRMSFSAVWLNGKLRLSGILLSTGGPNGAARFSGAQKAFTCLRSLTLLFSSTSVPTATTL